MVTNKRLGECASIQESQFAFKLGNVVQMSFRDTLEAKRLKTQRGSVSGSMSLAKMWSCAGVMKFI